MSWMGSLGFRGYLFVIGGVAVFASGLSSFGFIGLSAKFHTPLLQDRLLVWGVGVQYDLSKVSLAL